MRLSKTELGVLEQIARGNKDVRGIASALGKSTAQIYRSGRLLTENGLVELKNGSYVPTRTALTSLLLQLLSEYPSVIEPLADSGANLLVSLLEPRTIPGIMEETGLGRARVFKKLKQAQANSLVIKRANTYALNNKLWGLARDSLSELKRHEETTDRRVPANAVIYHKNEEDIVFSCREELDATLTAFSAYGDHGIKILSQRRFYYLPKRRLSLRDVFVHSLYVAEKEQDPRHFTLIAIFHAKHKKRLSGVKHVILESLERVLTGERVPGYPTREEIAERGEVYDIRL
ncbi:hypothetical protein J4439_08580 [Candidatus Woesearchaeota archaeon]|nr:hypothetical protein [Candidatus Woesearchaeota archaeon]